jgi:hypothetical protein
MTSHEPRTTNHGGPKKLDFRFAMAAYIVLATLAMFTLDGPMLGAVLLLLAALAVKTWIHTIRERE